MLSYQNDWNQGGNWLTLFDLKMAVKKVHMCCFAKLFSDVVCGNYVTLA